MDKGYEVRESTIMALLKSGIRPEHVVRIAIPIVKWILSGQEEKKD